MYPNRKQAEDVGFNNVCIVLHTYDIQLTMHWAFLPAAIQAQARKAAYLKACG